GVETPSDCSAPITSPRMITSPRTGPWQSTGRKMPVVRATIRRSGTDSVSPTGTFTGVSAGRSCSGQPERADRDLAERGPVGQCSPYRLDDPVEVGVGQTAARREAEAGGEEAVGGA